MKLQPKYILVAIIFAMLAPVYASAADNQVYGWQLMSEQERNEYRTKMQSMKTQEERNQFREEHHKQMQERAKAQGVTLPDMPASGMGPGKGMGQGQGMHQGQGMNQGMGQGMGQGMHQGMGQQGSGGGK